MDSTNDLNPAVQLKMHCEVATKKQSQHNGNTNIHNRVGSELVSRQGSFLGVQRQVLWG